MTDSIDEKIANLWDRMFKKYYSGDQMNDWQEVTFFGGGNKDKYIKKIEELLAEGKRVKTGYRTSKMVRGSKTFYIFYK